MDYRANDYCGSFVERNLSPDAKPSAKAVRKAVASTQITLTVADDLLQRLDDLARVTGQSRFGLIKVGIIVPALIVLSLEARKDPIFACECWG
jgi:hypothetical protein